MRLLPNRSRKRISSAAYTPLARSAATHRANEPSRHDAAIIDDRAVPADPFEVWLEHREADELLKRETDETLKRELESLLQRS